MSLSLETLTGGRFASARDALASVEGLASQADLARRWGLSRQRVHELVREPQFPVPAAIVSGQPAWIAAEADEWLEYRGLFISQACLEQWQ